jgi:hypothetical protein
MSEQMRRDDFQADVLFLGYEHVAVTDHVHQDDFEVISASVTAGLEQISTLFIRPRKNCRLASIENMRQFIHPTRKTYFVGSESRQDQLAKLKARLTEMISAEVQIEFVLRERLISRRVDVRFADYLTALKAKSKPPEFYETPRPVSDANADLQVMILDWLRTSSKSDQRLFVIRAEAGVGKTSLARCLAHTLADTQATNHHRIPIFVESEHWNRIKLDFVDDVWAIVDNSLSIYAPTLRLRRTEFEHLFAKGLIVFIFDGFDELCMNRDARFRPLDVLTDLQRLAENSLSSVILTTRIAYWEAEVGAAATGLRVEDLSRFKNPQVSRYFERRFANRPNCLSAARSLFERVKQDSRPRSGGAQDQVHFLPYVVELIASAAESGVDGTGMTNTSDGPSALRAIVEDMCRREKQRRNFVTPAPEQLSAFCDVAADMITRRETKFSCEVLQAAGILDSDLRLLGDHPLLRRLDSNERGAWLSFRYEFLPAMLTAEYLVGSIRSGQSKMAQPVLRLMSELRGGSTPVIDHMCGHASAVDLRTKASVRFWECHEGGQFNAASFLFHLGRRLHLSEGLSTTRRLEESLTFLEEFAARDFARNRIISRQHFIGTIETVDFRGAKFEHCTFLDVKFSDCLVDEMTSFVGCVFDGDFEILSSVEELHSGWGKVARVNCSMRSSAARLALGGLGQVEESERSELAREMITAALRKFWSSGHVQRSINAANWKRGMLRQITQRDEILDALVKAEVLVFHKISGVSDGGILLKPQADRDVAQLMDNGFIVGRVKDAYDLLLASI